MEFQNVSSLPAEVQKHLIPCIRDLSVIDQDQMISVAVYGSAAGQNFIPGVSDINTLIVVREVSADFLKKSLRPIMRARRRRIAAPLILTREHIVSSLDVFPIEFLDMKERHVLIYGEDLLSGLEIRGEHTRLFCEQQIKGTLIRIRQTYLEVGLRKKGIEALLKDSLSSLFPVFRRMVILKGAVAPDDKETLLQTLGEVFQINPDDMVAIWKDRRNDERIAGEDVREVFGRYIARLEDLAKIADQL